MSEKGEMIFGGLLIVLVFAFLIAFKFWSASQEAQSYRKFCDRPVTTWDALFLDLRIDECKKDQ